MANLFDKTKKATVKKKIDKHEVVRDDSMEPDLKKLVELNEKIAALDAERKMLDSDVRDIAKSLMIEYYNKKKKFPGTLKVVGGKYTFSFITADRYKKLDMDRFDELSNKYGSDLVEETIKYVFNTEILEKHMDHISDLILNSKKLSESDKEELLEAETSFTVKKGTIKDLFDIPGVITVNEIIEDIQPVFSIKAIKEDK